MFSDNLRERRKELRMTQAQLAELLGVSRQTVSVWEHNEKMPSNDKLIKIADILGLSLDQLTGRNTNVPDTNQERHVDIKPLLSLRRKNPMLFKLLTSNATDEQILDIADYLTR